MNIIRKLKGWIGKASPDDNGQAEPIFEIDEPDEVKDTRTEWNRLTIATARLRRAAEKTDPEITAEPPSNV